MGLNMPVASVKVTRAGVSSGIVGRIIESLYRANGSNSTGKSKDRPETTTATIFQREKMADGAPRHALQNHERRPAVRAGRGFDDRSFTVRCRRATTRARPTV